MNKPNPPEVKTAIIHSLQEADGAYLRGTGLSDQSLTSGFTSALLGKTSIMWGEFPLSSSPILRIQRIDSRN